MLKCIQNYFLKNKIKYLHFLPFVITVSSRLSARLATEKQTRVGGAFTKGGRGSLNHILCSTAEIKCCTCFTYYLTLISW